MFLKEFSLTEKEKVIKIKLTGEIDIVNAEEFYIETEKIYLQNFKDIEFDLSGVKFIDSTALGTFVKISNLLKKDGKKLTVKKLREQIKRLFLICSLDSVINIEA
jgi:anti-anti-sigma factor